MAEMKKTRIKINDLDPSAKISAEEMKKVKGGIYSNLLYTVYGTSSGTSTTSNFSLAREGVYNNYINNLK